MRQRQHDLDELVEVELGDDVRLVVGDPRLVLPLCARVVAAEAAAQLGRELGRARSDVRRQQQVEARLRIEPEGDPHVRHHGRVLGEAPEPLGPEDQLVEFLGG